MKNENDYGMRPRRIDSVKVIEVIEVEYAQGEGIEGDPVRRVVEYWTLEGKRIATKDPCLPILEESTERP